MGSRVGTGLPLSERTRRSSRTPSGAPAATAGRHCWVVDPPGERGKWPGLLVEWRQEEDGWHGRVIYVLALPDEGQRVVERWLPVGFLHPAL
jgi:hypothetical protein